MNTGEGDENKGQDAEVPEGERPGEEGDVGREKSSTEKVEEEVEEVIDDGEENAPLVPRLRLTKKQKEDIYEAFRLLDNVGNGLIDASKYRIALYALGYEATPEELKEMIAAVGETPYGKLSLGNFVKLIMNKCVAKDSECDIIKSFLYYDIDKIGEVYPENIKRVAQLIDDDTNNEEIMEMFQAADDEDLGFLDVSSFIRMMNQCVSLKIEKEYE